MNPAAQRPRKRQLTVAAALVQLLLASTAVNSAPPIRTGDSNRMPACVSPERLMAFLEDRNSDLDPKYRDIAKWYKQWGDTWRVRWDYAFFQMVIETNYLKYRRGNGRRGDVNENQNNFAGIGATGGGVAGNRFPDVKTGVLAQIQHLVAYSGERIVKPVAPRTELAQNSIVEQSRRLKRPVTYSDLARRWAADRKYGKTIDFVAEQFFTGYCTGPATVAGSDQELVAAARQRAKRFARPTGLGGPKMQKLAGPETMPWVDGINTAQDTSRANEQNAPEKNRAPEKSGPPVRTIWSREKGFEIAPEPAKGNAAVDPADAEPPVPNAGTAATPEGGAPRSAAVNETTTRQQESSEESETALPTFKIAPAAMPAPSHLGGPVDDVSIMDNAPAPAGAAAEAAVAPPVPKPVRAAPKQAALASPAVPQPAPSGPSGPCRVLTASYGGKKTLLVRSARNGGIELTALSVVEGFEQSMLNTYAKASAPGAELLSEHTSKDDAVAAANALCAGG